MKAFAVACVLAASALSLAPSQDIVKPRIPEPEVPAELASRGVVYHTLSGREAQVTFTSRAPLENIVGKSNEVVGYAIAGDAAHPAALAGARWILPVKSLATGIPLRDDHMTGREWLDAAAHPTIEFELRRVEDVEPVKSGEGFSTWDATLVGVMTLHGVERDLRVPDARMSFLEASERTATIAPGDLLFLKCEYSVKLSDFGISHHDVPKKVSDDIRLVQMLRLSTVRPEPETPES